MRGNPGSSSISNPRAQVRLWRLTWSEDEDKRHLKRLLEEFIEEYYHTARPHQGIGGETPIPQEKPPILSGQSKLVSIPVPGGLHHRYVRVAA